MHKIMRETESGMTVFSLPLCTPGTWIHRLSDVNE